MARILLVVAVCYCAICAHVAAVQETTLLKDHIAGTPIDTWQASPPYKLKTDTILDDVGEQNVPKQLRERRQSFGDIESVNFDDHQIPPSDIANDRSRSKRHAGGHGHANSAVSEQREYAAPFVKKLFQQFGNGDAETMDVAGFEKMLEHLGLYRFIEDEETTVSEEAAHPTSLNANKTVSDWLSRYLILIKYSHTRCYIA